MPVVERANMRMKPRTNIGNFSKITRPTFTLSALSSRFTYQTASQRTMIGSTSTRVMLKISATFRVSMPSGW